jgi:hypothetical protein
VALQITASPLSPVIHFVSPGSGWLTLLTTFLIGAATALAVQLVVQRYIVPRVETRNRREDRWERQVLELGELLTTEVGQRARDARSEEASWRRMQQAAQTAKAERAIQEQGPKVYLATMAFADLAETRVWWLVRRIADQRSGEIRKFVNAWRSYEDQMVAALPRPTRERFERSDAAVQELWKRESDARIKLIEQVNVLASLTHPPRATMLDRWAARKERNKPRGIHRPVT